MKRRDYHQKAIARRETRGHTTAIPSGKQYTRKQKHKSHRAHCQLDNGALSSWKEKNNLQ